MADQKSFPWGSVILGILLIVAMSAAVWFYLHPQVKTVPGATITVPVYEQVPVETVVQKIVKVPVYVTKVMAYDKPAVVKALDIPFQQISSPRREVIADADIPAAPGGASVITVLDTVTGESSELVKIRPAPLPPFFAFPNRIGLGLFYGFSSQESQKGQVSGDWTFLRTGPVMWQLKTEINTRPEFLLLGGARFEFNP